MNWNTSAVTVKAPKNDVFHLFSNISYYENIDIND